jgi:hypothetical protein
MQGRIDDAAAILFRALRKADDAPAPAPATTTTATALALAADNNDDADANDAPEPLPFVRRSTDAHELVCYGLALYNVTALVAARHAARGSDGRRRASQVGPYVLPI